MGEFTKRSKKRLTKSEIQYGYVYIPKGKIRNVLPQGGEPVVVMDSDNRNHNLVMHNSQLGRIDGLTQLYKDFQVQEGDFLEIKVLDGNILSLSFYELTLRHRKK